MEMLFCKILLKFANAVEVASFCWSSVSKSKTDGEGAGCACVGMEEEMEGE